MGAASGALVVVPDDARVINLGSFEIAVLAEAASTAGAFSMMETREAEPGTGPPLHIHRDAAESFYVIEGEYRMHVDGRDFVCPAGSFIFIPAGTVHTFSSRTPGTRKLNLFTPAAMVGYFDELAEAIRAGVDPSGLDAIAERYAMEIVGPIPDSYL